MSLHGAWLAGLVGAILFSSIGCSVPSGSAGVRPVELRCEYAANPLGLDTARPRLSWQLGADAQARNVMQTGYRVLVASSAEQLAAGQGDLWDCGKIDSDQSTHVEYVGKQLASHQQCFWKVQVWYTMAGQSAPQASPWSEAAHWSMGILDGGQWNAKWLGYSRPMKRDSMKGSAAELLTFDNVQWIWTSEAAGGKPAAKGTRYFRRAIALPADAQVKWAYLLISADDHYRLFVNGFPTSDTLRAAEGSKRGIEVEMTHRLRPGRNVLAIDAVKDAPGTAGLAAKLVVELASGQRIVVATDDQWTCATAGKGAWNKAEFDDSKWTAATALGKVGGQPWGTPKVGYHAGWSQQSPSPIFRKNFSVDKPVKRAVAYVCGLGYHELHLNGKKVGDRVLDPAFTRYDRRSLYVTHDVTDQLDQGSNAIGVMLGNGWYNMHTRCTWDFDQAPWRDQPKLLMQLRIEYADGSVETVVTDETWRASTGPVYLDSIRAGEFYDANLETPGWDTPKFDDSKWAKPQIVKAPGGLVSAMTMPPMRVTQSIKPAKITQPRPGVYIVDVGQNMTGWAQLRVSGKKGHAVTMRYAERLDDKGMLDNQEIGKFVFGGPFQADTYVLKGNGEEVWEPRFVYHGFQYIEVTGYAGELTPEKITARVVHTDFAPAGQFECSDNLLNTIQRLTRWSYRGNFHGYPTDCPHREKNGWTGDASLACEQAMYNWHNEASYHKWIWDLHDEQRHSGEVAAIIPTAGWGYAWGNGPAWDSAFVLIPWYLYEYRGDLRILADNYERMRLYVDYVLGKSKDLIAAFGLGDWCPADTKTPFELTSTGYFYVDTLVVAKSAKLLGKDADAAKYADLARRIRKAFNRTFYKGDGVYANGSQTALSCALYQGLVEDSEKPKVVARLAAAVKAKNDHLDVGILGAKYLFHTLSENGHHDAALRIATQTTFPSYGDWIEHGATTLWEDWDYKGSLNHIMFGDISAWMYQELGGIHADVQRPGFKHIIIRPRPGNLTWARAEHDSVYGPIRSSWRRSGNGIEMDVTVPPNTTATVFVPAKGLDQASCAGVKAVKYADGFVQFEVGSGTYTFTGK